MKQLLMLFGLFCMLVVLAFGYQLRSHQPNFPSTNVLQASPSPSANLAIAPIDVHCISEDDVQRITGVPYTLVNENPLPEAQALVCSYTANAQNRGETPSLQYTLHLHALSEQWDAARTEIEKKSSQRKISGHDELIADLNPVFEIAQVTFAGYYNQVLLSLTYSPIDGNPGDVLSVGQQLSQFILGEKQ